MRVVLWGTADLGKPRVRILLEGLRANGVELIECRTDPWHGIRDKSQIKGVARWLRLLATLVAAYPRLVWRYLSLPKHDWVLLGYPALIDVFVIRGFAWLRGARVAMDWFLSAYDTVVLDRRMVGRRHPLAVILRAAEWCAVRAADCVFMDTRAHAVRMERLFGMRPGSVGAVWVGVESGVFAGSGVQPDQPPPPPPGAGALRVLFYGQFIPLHGIPVIVEAAKLLRDQPVDWLIIGTGQEAARVRALIENDPLPRLQWIEWADYPALLRHIGSADLCLGIFGTSDKAASVIPNKVFQTLAMNKPLITRDSPAIRELVPSSSPDVQLVPPGDPHALAEAVRRFAQSSEARAAGRTTGERIAAFDEPAVGRQLLRLLQPVSNAA